MEELFFNEWLKQCKESLLKGKTIHINDSLSIDGKDLTNKFFELSSEDENLDLSIDELMDLILEKEVAPKFYLYVKEHNNQMASDAAIDEYEFNKAVA